MHDLAGSDAGPSGQPDFVPSSRARKSISPPALTRQTVHPAQTAHSPAAAAAASTSSEVHEVSMPYRISDESKMSSQPARQAMPDNSGSTPQSVRNTARTPRTTPKKIDWTTEKIEELLRGFSEEIGRDGARTALRLIDMNWKQKPPTRRFVSSRDWFSGVRLEPAGPDVPASGAMRVNIKVGGSSAKSSAKSNKKGKCDSFPVARIKTDKEPVPPYSFHHIEVSQNLTTPNTMLTYMPHLKDLATVEEPKYHRWLSHLKDLDRQSNIPTMKEREDKVHQTSQKERAYRLLSYLDDWLHRMGIENCNKAALVRHLTSQMESMTPQQKTTIHNSYDDGVGDDQSPRSERALRMFAEAFDNVFNAEKLGDRAISLLDVVQNDQSIGDITDPKKWVKDTPVQSKASEVPTSVEEFCDTYALMGCLICCGHSCEHGEYERDNYKKRMSIGNIGGLSSLLSNRPPRAADSDVAKGLSYHDARPSCGEDCFLNGKPGTRAKGWSQTEIMVLKSIFMTFHETSVPVQCTVSLFTGRPCWDVNRQLDKLDLRLPTRRTSEAPKMKSLPWYDRWEKRLLGDWKAHTITHEHQSRPISDPCMHEGPCTRENCSCVQNHVLCEKFCRCSVESCAHKFTGCACRSLGKTCLPKQKELPKQRDRLCICVQLNRECDPYLCGGCGVTERAKHANVDNHALLATGCQNCALQRGGSKSLILGRSTICGYGLFSAEDIAPDTFVIEYVGEIISQDEGCRREARRGDVFDENGATSYLFTLLESEGTWVDAAVYGNLSRYINHQEHHANVEPTILYVNGEYRIKFSSTRHIKAGDELFFNYGKNFPNLTKDLLEQGEEKKKKRRRAKDGWETDKDDDKTKTKKKPGRKTGAKLTKKQGPNQRFQKVSPDTEAENGGRLSDASDDGLSDTASGGFQQRQPALMAYQDSEDTDFQPSSVSRRNDGSGVQNPVGRKKKRPRHTYAAQAQHDTDNDSVPSIQNRATKRSHAAEGSDRDDAGAKRPENTQRSAKMGAVSSAAKENGNALNRHAAPRTSGNTVPDPESIYLVNGSTDDESYQSRTQLAGQRRDRGNDEYNGQSWTDGNGVRHGGYEIEDSEQESEAVSQPALKKRKATRFVE